MSNSSQRGFTLIEIILVIAISGALLSIAFAGQAQLRRQSQFDAAVNKVVSSINDARNQATAGINTEGAGNGTNGCTNAGGYVFAGIAWVATGPGEVRLDYYKAVPQSIQAGESCIFSSQRVSLPAPLQFNAANAAAFQGGRELFVRTNDVLSVCPITNNTVDVSAIFRSGACPPAVAPGVMTLDITDGGGRQGLVEIDRSGLAQRRF